MRLHKAERVSVKSRTKRWVHLDKWARKRSSNISKRAVQSCHFTALALLPAPEGAKRCQGSRDSRFGGAGLKALGGKKIEVGEIRIS